MRVYRVGGAVRDALLGLPPGENDWVVTGSSPEEMIQRGFQQVGSAFPVFLHPATHEEYALARRERKIAPGHTGFAVEASRHVTLEEDLSRRDLTLNAIAEATDGHLIDPFDGQGDVARRVLRHVSPAFAEDPLRVLRVARFHARLAPLGFTVAEETRELMARIVDSGELAALTPQRVWKETEKALAAPRPSLYFTTLQACGALHAVFPELAALIGQEQPPAYHPEGDAWTHTLLAVDAAAGLSPDPAVRLAALLHDLGKGITPKAQLPRHVGHDEKGGPLVEAFCRRWRLPNAHRHLARLAAIWHLRCHWVEEMRPGSIVTMLEGTDAFRNDGAVFEKLLPVFQADSLARGPLSNDAAPQIALLRRCREACLGVDSAALLAAGWRGEKFGERLHQARAQAVRRVMRGGAAGEFPEEGAEKEGG
ncbi:MAG: multifunctional CCA addition/repair protein [Magnetococcales bacterium]|nr:multifunctional CCA addition/repair protein [Magnetococcales bacterium]